MYGVIYVVWGPSLEWGDGVGPIGYALTPQDARQILREERDLEREYGPRSWAGSVRLVGYVEPVPAKELGWDGQEPLERFVERLNEAL